MITLQDFTSQTEPLLTLLTRLVEIESPSTDKAAVDRLGEWLAAELRYLGAQVDVAQQEKAGNNLIARWNPNPEKAGILALCHMDTVYAAGTLAQRPLRIERQGQGGRLYAPGALDMKGGIACFLIAIHRLQELQTDWLF